MNPFNTVVVSNTDTLIDVPAGTFSCHRYDYYDADGRLLESEFYSSGTGRIQMLSFYIDGRFLSQLKLVSYTLH